MKRINRRSWSVLLLALLLVAGLAVYVTRYVENGKRWATYFSSANSGSSGAMYDRNGILLAEFDATEYKYAEDMQLRRANYHVTGDYWGRTGTGLLSAFWNNSADYSLVTGTTVSKEHYLSLTVNANANLVAYQAFAEGTRGCIMVVNYKTGEVLCMVSVPTVDPLDNAEPADGAFINRCLSASFVPGSIFKLVTAAAAIETVPNIDSREFYCDHVYEIAGVEISCVGTHYTQNFAEALANSCNTAFAQITVKIGQDNMVQHVRQYGFLDRQTLNGISSAKGSYPLEFVGDPELAWSGIGQSTDLVCPYTMLRYVSAIANGGVLVEPTLIRANTAPGAVQLLNGSTARRMQELMRNNVISHYGTERFPGLIMCAKTGTAEVGDGDPHAWFTGFLADDDNPYAFIVLVENGGYGIEAAAPIATKVLQYLCSNNG